MANIADVKIHDVMLSVDLDKMSPASLMNAVRTALTRRLSLGAKTKTVDELTKLAGELKENPNPFFEAVRGEGTGRTSRSPAELRGAVFFNAFTLALKTPSIGKKHDDAKKSWTKYGGIMVDEYGKPAIVLKAAKEDSAERKNILDANIAAKKAIIAAKIKKEGWDKEEVDTSL